MDIKRRNNSAYMDLDITDGDAVWFCTDRYNASGPNRLGGGRLRLRNVQWKGDQILSHGDFDYGLKVSSAADSEQFWVGNQAGRESDMQSLAIHVDGVLRPMDAGDEHRGAREITIGFTTRVFLDDPANTPFASLEWHYKWADGVYTFGVKVTYLADVFRWFEYTSMTPSVGFCGDENPWKCGRVEAGSEDYGSLGCQNGTSEWLTSRPATTFNMYFKRNSSIPHGGQAKVTIVSADALPQMVNDHGDNFVVTHHVANDGVASVVQSAGNQAKHRHTITLA